MAEKVLVTGGAGFIGSHVAEHLLDAGCEVVIVDDLSTGRRESVPGRAAFYEADITDRDALREVFRREKPTVVDHHAAQINVRVSVEDPIRDARINIMGMLEVLEASRLAGVRRIIFASSGGAIYGEPGATGDAAQAGDARAGIPVPESHPARPMSPYGAAKLAGEYYLECFKIIYGLEAVILRYGNVYGPRQDPRGEAGVMAIFIDRLLRDEPPVIFGDGRQTRDYVYVEDVARANVAALAKGSGAYNIGTGREASVLELLDVIRRAMGSTASPQHVEERAGEVRHIALDCSRAAGELGWRPGVGLEAGIENTVSWHRKTVQG